jgi:hypothetical protein
MKQITEETTPNVFNFVESAANYRNANAAWGDGVFLSQIMALIMKLLPIFMTCFASKEAFVENVKDLTWTQKMQLHIVALRQAKRMSGVARKDHRAVAEAAFNGMASRLEEMSDVEVGACFDELKDND